MYTVDSDAWTSTAVMIAFAVACASTAVQGLIAHAFRQTIGDIVVTANSLGDVEHIKNTLDDPEQNTKYVGSVDAGTFGTHNHNYYPIHTAIDTRAVYTGRTATSNKRLDTRGFFQSIPTSLAV